MYRGTSTTYEWPILRFNACCVTVNYLKEQTVIPMKKSEHESYRKWLNKRDMSGPVYTWMLLCKMDIRWHGIKLWVAQWCTHGVHGKDLHFEWTRTGSNLGQDWDKHYTPCSIIDSTHENDNQIPRQVLHCIYIDLISRLFTFKHAEQEQHR